MSPHSSYFFNNGVMSCMIKKKQHIYCQEYIIFIQCFEFTRVLIPRSCKFLVNRHV